MGKVMYEIDIKGLDDVKTIINRIEVLAGKILNDIDELDLLVDELNLSGVEISERFKDIHSHEI